ncbi:MAG TPA: helix-turn-helix domain-containing protein [Noviherbaspirillum sp.]
MRGIADGSRIDAMFEALDRADTISDHMRIFQEYLLSTLALDQKKGMAETFFSAHQKMFFPLIDLAEFFGIGRRQLERRVRDVFGVSLRDVRRLSRWGLCVERLVNAQVAWGDLAHLAQESGYFDQAHMTREFVDLSGLAPLPLLKKIASDDPGFWAYRIKGQDFKNLFLPV